MGDSRSILIVEDDDSICQVIRLHLEREGFLTEATASGDEGLKKALEKEYSLIILDLQLQGLGGIEVCKKIREQKKYVPIIMLTSRSAEIDKVIGLEVGADDYVTKPFSVYELTARIRARLRIADKPGESSEAENKSQTLVFGNLSIDVMRRKVVLDGKQIDLTPKEFEVLVFLAQRPGRPFTREILLESVWNLNAPGYADTVGALIQRLRKKIERDPARPMFVRTVRGVGYRFVEQHEFAEGDAPAVDEEEDG